MTREEKIAAIYKEMADKELTFGCKVKFSKGIYSIIDRENVGFLDSYKRQDGGIHNTIVIEDGVNSRCYSIEEIIGHPVMIGDALEVLDAIAANRDNARYERRLRDILMVWSKPRKPIDEQPDECIDLVYSLIQKD